RVLAIHDAFDPSIASRELHGELERKVGVFGPAPARDIYMLLIFTSLVCVVPNLRRPIHRRAKGSASNKEITAPPQRASMIVGSLRPWEEVWRSERGPAMIKNSLRK